MPSKLYDVSAPKRPTNLTINGDLLKRARTLGINLSQTLEQRLIEILHAERQRRWLEENREAIHAFNEYIERNGSITDDYRSF